MIVLLAGCGSSDGSDSQKEAEPFTVDDVRSAFLSQGESPTEVVDEFGEEWERFVVSEDEPPLLPTAFLEPERPGQPYLVLVYWDSESAGRAHRKAPEIDPIFRERRAVLINDNLLVIVQPPDPSEIERVEAALAELS